MHDRAHSVAAGADCGFARNINNGGLSVLCVRILDTTQIRRLIAFSSAVDVTI
jgi:hypothetical protein